MRNYGASIQVTPPLEIAIPVDGLVTDIHQKIAVVLQPFKKLPLPFGVLLVNNKVKGLYDGSEQDVAARVALEIKV